MDGRGVPLSVVVTGANRHDVSQLQAVLANKIVEPIMGSKYENLCADAGYAGEALRKVILAAGYEPHVRSRGEEQREKVGNALRGHGQMIDDALLQYLSPLGWEHINLTGDYLWRSSAKIGGGKFRPQRPLQPA